MQNWINSLIAAGEFGKNPPRDLIYAAFIFVLSAIVFLGVAFPFAGIVSWVERRVWARIQSRVGPNRVGPNGSLQWLADGAKHVLKEDIIPDEADARLFKLAPYLVVLGFVLPWAVMPFSSALILADLNVGILYFTAITALTVVGVLMAGMGVGQQVVADRRNPLGGADHQLRDSRRDVDFPGRADHRHALDAGNYPGAGMGAVSLVPVLESVLLRRGDRALHIGAGRGQSHAVRSAGGRVRAGRRFRDRVQRDALPAFLLRRVGQHVHRRRAHHDPVPRRMAGAAAELEPARDERARSC